MSPRSEDPSLDFPCVVVEEDHDEKKAKNQICSTVSGDLITETPSVIITKTLEESKVPSKVDTFNKPSPPGIHASNLRSCNSNPALVLESPAIEAVSRMESLVLSVEDEELLQNEFDVIEAEPELDERMLLDYKLRNLKVNTGFNPCKQGKSEDDKSLDILKEQKVEETCVLVNPTSQRPWNQTSSCLLSRIGLPLLVGFMIWYFRSKEPVTGVSFALEEAIVQDDVWKASLSPGVGAQVIRKCKFPLSSVISWFFRVGTIALLSLGAFFAIIPILPANTPAGSAKDFDGFVSKLVDLSTSLQRRGRNSLKLHEFFVARRMLGMSYYKLTVSDLYALLKAFGVSTTGLVDKVGLVKALLQAYEEKLHGMTKEEVKVLLYKLHGIHFNHGNIVQFALQKGF